ncbi:MAG: DUF4231 domain-containing protein [bacterium]
MKLFKKNIEPEQESGYRRLDQQIQWYDNKSTSSKRKFKIAKIIEICLAALIPFLASINVSVTAMLGVAITILEGIQQLCQWSKNWITYRSTCEALRHEKYLYLGKSGVYEDKDENELKIILTQRVESLVSTEHSKWNSRQEYEIKKKIMN